MVRIPTHRAPTHPGEMLLEEFVKPLNLTQSDLAVRLGISFPRLNEVIRAKRCPDSDSPSSAACCRPSASGSGSALPMIRPAVFCAVGAWRMSHSRAITREGSSSYDDHRRRDP